MDTHHQQSPLSASESASCSTPYPTEFRKRKRSLSGVQPPREYGLMRDTGEHDAARFVGSGSGIHYIRAVYLRLARKSASRTTQASSRTAATTLVPGEDDQLRQLASDTFESDKPLWKPHEVSPTPLAGNVMPNFDDLVDWSRSFFESWHPILPFLHGPDVLQIFEDASSRGMSAISPLDFTIMRSVLSISLADSRQGPPLAKPIPSHFVFQSVEEAVAASQFALSRPASIRATQAALAIQLFLTSMLCLNAASRLGGLIVRMAFHLGLHRCPARFGFFTSEGASIRRRVLWCIYIVERFLCQSLGLPLDIHDDDLDVCYPGEERHGGSNDCNDDIERLQLLALLAKHARIRGLVLELRNKSVQQRQDTAERTAAVQTELAKWANEIQDVEEEEDETGELEDPEMMGILKLSPSHRLMLLVLKHESTICLNRPGLASEPSSLSYSSAFQSCISAAKSICVLFNKYKRHHKLPGDESAKRLAIPLLWPSFTWSVWISTFVLLHAAFENQVPMPRALRHATAGKDMLRHLAMREASWPEYCLEAIDELISAVQEMSRTPMNTRDSPNTLLRTQAHCDNTAPMVSQRYDKVTRPSKRRGAASRWNTSTGGMEGDSAAESAVADGNALDVNQHAAQCSETASSGAPSGSVPLITLGHRRSMQTSSDIAVGINDSTNGPPDVMDSRSRQGSAMAMAPNAIEGDVANGPVEGQESLLWYDQLFASSFNAIENPFLVAAEFDTSIDTTWSHLR